MNIRDVLRPSVRERTVSAERRPQKKSASFTPQKNTDRLTLSKEALAFVKEQNRLAWEKTPEQEASSPLKQLEKDQKKQEKCMIIASRLRRGDKIPPEDEKYLMVHDPSFYLLSLSQRKENPHPKEWESILDEEDLKELESIESGESAGSDGISAMSMSRAPAAAPVTGAGEI